MENRLDFDIQRSKESIRIDKENQRKFVIRHVVGVIKNLDIKEDVLEYLNKI